jgi:dephospho-CoA kinase
MQSRFKLGVTGGIGCGKSTAGDVLRALDVEVLDTDDVAHSLLQSDREVHRRLAERFGSTILGPEGIDRAALGRIVFADAAARRDLEAVLHPLIRSKATDWMASRTGDCAVLVPLLFEVGWENDFQPIACVACSPAIQRQRLAARGLNDAAIDLRLKAQLSEDGPFPRRHLDRRPRRAPDGPVEAGH